MVDILCDVPISKDIQTAIQDILNDPSLEIKDEIYKLAQHNPDLLQYKYVIKGENEYREYVHTFSCINGNGLVHDGVTYTYYTYAVWNTDYETQMLEQHGVCLDSFGIKYNAHYIGSHVHNVIYSNRSEYFINNEFQGYKPNLSYEQCLKQGWEFLTRHYPKMLEFLKSTAKCMIINIDDEILKHYTACNVKSSVTI